MKIKRIALGIALALTLGGVASAQQSPFQMVVPDGEGGYTIYGPNGMTRALPTGVGGYYLYPPAAPGQLPPIPPVPSLTMPGLPAPAQPPYITGQPLGMP